MKIVICDDEKFFANDIKTKVENFMYKNRIESDIHTFYCSETFEDDSFYDIAFLDIEMPGLNGIELATKLKKVNPDIIIFFITSYDKYLDDAMDLNVFRYLKKPINDDRFFSALNKCIAYIDNNSLTVFAVNTSEVKSIKLNDILYIEIIGRKTRLLTVKGECISDNKIDYWENKLIQSFFYRVHKSYIVNLKHITDYERDSVTLEDKYVVPVSYRKQTDFRQVFMKYLGGK